MNAPGLPFPKLKQKRCKYRVCREVFTPKNPLQPYCCPMCERLAVAERKLKDTKAYEAQLRKETRSKREALKTRRDYINEAQTVFNRFVRVRDAGKPCICCGKTIPNAAVGGSGDAGHYRSVGSAPHLRFDERNCHLQDKQCNRWGAGRAVDYRIGLIQRIGLEAVEALEADQEPRKHSIGELKAIRDLYRAKLKALKEIA